MAGGIPGSPLVKTLPSNAGVEGLIPSQEAKIPHALQAKSQNRKQNQYCNKWSKDLENGSHPKKIN